MQRKPGYPVSNCNIKMPDSIPASEGVEDEEPVQRRQQLINFGHSQWGFNNWSWSVTKQDLDFADMTNGKYSAGVVAFVCVTVKSLDIHRENIGYATALAPYKGAAIHNARKCAVTNALRETLLSFGGKVATDLLEQLETHRNEVPNQNLNSNQKQNQNVNQNQNPTPNQKHVPPDAAENQNIANKPVEKNVLKVKMEDVPSAKVPIVPLKNVPNPPVARAHPMPANVPANMPRPTPNANANANANVNVNANIKPHRPPDVRPPAPQPAPLLRPNSNVSFVLQPVMYSNPPRLAPPPPMFPNYYECSGPWHFYDPYDRHHGNVNLNFNMPPKNLVVNGRPGSVECKGREEHYSGQGCWIKPSIFYDGFWTEQKVKKWVAEQVEKQFPGDGSSKPPHDPSPNT